MSTVCDPAQKRDNHLIAEEIVFPLLVGPPLVDSSSYKSACNSIPSTSHALVVDPHHEGVIDENDFLISGQLAAAVISACHSLSYTTGTALRKAVNKLRINDSKLQIDDFTLQIGDFTLQTGDLTLQIGDFTLRIGDFTLSLGSSKRRFDVTTRWIVDLNVLTPSWSFKSTIRNFKSTMRNFKSAI
jgi:hypothetical protein